jgi:hypothetical protein
MGVGVPELIRSATENVSLVEHVAGPPHRGSVVVVEGDGVTRMCVVTRVYDDHYIVALCHPYREMLTEVDAIVEGLPYPFFVQSDLTGCIDKDQIRAHIAIIDIPVALEGDRYNDVAPALLGPPDGRWRFKTDEGKNLRALARRCTNRMLGFEVI